MSLDSWLLLASTLAAVVAVVFAWRAVREARRTTEQLTAIAGQLLAVDQATRSTVTQLTAIAETTGETAKLTAETQAEGRVVRRLDVLYRLSTAIEQMNAVCDQGILDRPTVPFLAAKAVVVAAMVGVPAGELEACHSIANARNAGEAQRDILHAQSQIRADVDRAVAPQAGP